MWCLALFFACDMLVYIVQGYSGYFWLGVGSIASFWTVAIILTSLYCFGFSNQTHVTLF